MTEHEDKKSEGHVPCEICLKEIPRSEAKVEEASDYFIYFCGLECYGKWQEENSNSE